MGKSCKLNSKFIPANSLDIRTIDYIEKSMASKYGDVSKNEVEMVLKQEARISSSALLMCIEVEKRLKTALLNKVFPTKVKVSELGTYVQKDLLVNMNGLKAKFFKRIKKEEESKKKVDSSYKVIQKKEIEMLWQETLINQHIEGGSFNDVILILSSLKMRYSKSIELHFSGICKTSKSLISVMKFINNSRNELVHELSLFKVKKTSLSKKKWLTSSGTASGYTKSPIKNLVDIEIHLIKSKILHRKTLTGAVNGIEMITNKVNVRNFLNLYI